MITTLLGQTLSARFYLNQIQPNDVNTTDQHREGDPPSSTARTRSTPFNTRIFAEVKALIFRRGLCLR
jgi:hypothetical protein